MASDILNVIGGRIQKAARAVEAAKDVLTPQEREAVARYAKGLMRRP